MRYYVPTKKQRRQGGLIALVVGAVLLIAGIAAPGPIAGLGASVLALPAVLVGAPLVFVGIVYMLQGRK